MSTANISPISLLGREVFFKDLAFERHLLDLTLPPDYPEELRTSFVKGQVTEFTIRLRLKGQDGWEVVSDILVNDNYYDLADCHFFNVNLRTDL